MRILYVNNDGGGFADHKPTPTAAKKPQTTIA